MEATADLTTPTPQWYVMRDLKRANAKLPAYRQLADAGFRVFTPMTVQIVTQGGKKSRIRTPFVRDLLFVHSEKTPLDKIVDRTETLQYRYVKGAPYRTPMTVPAADMERFIAATENIETPRYYRPEELTPAMYGKRVRVICPGPLNGYEGTLLKTRGTTKKRLLIKLAGLLAAAIEITAPDYLELL